MRTILISILLFISSSISAYQYDLSLVAIFQNEAPYLKEWIEFHKLVGVQKIYLINHFSSDNFEEILQPYIESGDVDLTHSFDQHPNFNITQINEYEIIRKKCIGKSKWLAILDLDEFLFPVDSENLVEFLKEYEGSDIASLYVFWQCYGTSSVDVIPKNKLMIETLFFKANTNNDHNKYGKSIIRPERCISAGLHFTEPSSGFHSVLPNKTSITGNQMATYDGVIKLTVDVSRIRINHYWTRDEKYFLGNKVPRYTKWGARNEAMIRYPIFNKEYDSSIMKYAENLKLAVFNIPD